MNKTLNVNDLNIPIKKLKKNDCQVSKTQLQ